MKQEVIRKELKLWEAIINGIGQRNPTRYFYDRCRAATLKALLNAQLEEFDRCL